MIELRSKRVMVTGGNGFLGSYVVEGLTRRGCDPFIVRHKEYDLVSGDAVRKVYRDANPDVVIHLAAVVGGIGANRENPGRFFYENLMMGAQLIEEGRKFGIEKFVMAGTVCAYPKFTPVPFKEDDIWNGYPEETNAPYGIAKKALLVQCQSYRAQYGMNAVFVLPVNMYGPRDHFDPKVSHVIPAIIKKVIDAQKTGEKHIVCWGDGSPTREFIHAADAAEGILLAAERYDGAEPVNIGSGQEISIRELTELIAQLCEFKGEIRWDPSKPNGQPRRKLDTTRAKERFGFSAQRGLQDGLRETIQWYRQCGA